MSHMESERMFKLAIQVSVYIVNYLVSQQTINIELMLV